MTAVALYRFHFITLGYCSLFSALFTGDKSDREKHFSDKDVCRPYLLGICINDLFINTVEWNLIRGGGGGVIKTIYSACMVGALVVF